jgi:hypothetical protein
MSRGISRAELIAACKRQIRQVGTSASVPLIVPRATWRRVLIEQLGISADKVGVFGVLQVTEQSPTHDLVTFPARELLFALDDSPETRRWVKTIERCSSL